MKQNIALRSITGNVKMADTKHRVETEMLEVKPLNDIHPILKDLSGDEIDLFDLKKNKKRNQHG